MMFIFIFILTKIYFMFRMRKIDNFLDFQDISNEFICFLYDFDQIFRTYISEYFGISIFFSYFKNNVTKNRLKNRINSK